MSRGIDLRGAQRIGHLYVFVNNHPLRQPIIWLSTTVTLVRRTAGVLHACLGKKRKEQEAKSKAISPAPSAIIYIRVRVTLA